MKKLVLILAAALFAFSCVNEPVNNDVPGQSGFKVKLSVPEFSEVSTRATDEHTIVDVWALQYVENKLVKKTELTGQAGLFSGLDLPADAMTGDTPGNVIYFFANTAVVAGGTSPIADDSGSVFTVNTSTLDDLKAYQFEVDEESFNTNLMMRGEYKGAVVAGVATEATVEMTRMAVKINFNFDATALNQFVATSIQLCEVPNVTVFPANANEPELPVGGVTKVDPDNFVAYPTGGSSVFSNYNPQSIDVSLNATGAYTWYMAENARGSFTGVTTNREKNPTLSTHGMPENNAGFTHILLKGTCIVAGQLTDVSYYIYLGGNETGDMNLIANTTYTVTTTIKGVNEADSRIMHTTPTIDPLELLKEANSYILDATGEGQTFFIPVSQAEKGIEAVNTAMDSAALEFNPANWSADVLWQTWQATSIDNQLAVSRASIGEDTHYIRVVLPAGVVNGNNAVIALRNADGNILWSWHLWITDYDGTTIENNGIKLMDRNLGATVTGVSGSIAPPATAEDAVKLYGLMYQWGRKDPFTPSATGSTTAISIYGGMIGSAALAEGTGAGTGIRRIAVNASIDNNLANAVQNPTYFYHSGKNNDWYLGTGSTTGTQNNNLWIDVSGKTVFDPCPDGYHMPTGGTTVANNPWAGFNGFDLAGSYPVTNFTFNADGKTTAAPNTQPDNMTIFQWYLNGGVSADLSESVNGMRGIGSGATAGRLFSRDGGTQAWYPASGGRSSASGAFSTVGSSGYSWSGSTTGAYGYYLSFSSTYVYPASSSYRAYGFPVRCVQE